MGLEQITNLIRREIGRQLAFRTHSRVGVVTSYDKKPHAVKVQYQPDGTESGWIPLGRHHAGDTISLVHGATPGEQVVVSYLDGDIENPIISHFLHSDTDPAPQVDSGESLLTHLKTGASIKIDKAGAVTITTRNQTITVTAGSGDVNITGGNVTVTASTAGKLA